MPNNATWIEPPPGKKAGLGCFGKGCLLFVVLGLIAILLIGISSYFFVSHGVVATQPVSIPVEELAPDALADVKQRVEQFRSTPPTSLPTAAPTAAPSVEPNAPNETPTPAATGPTGNERQLVLTEGEINGLISANRKARGRAYVTLSGNTATVQVSIPTDKMPGLPLGYLNGSFNITTNGPTSLRALQVSRIETNGYSVPSGITSWSYRGNSIMGYALDAVAPYRVSTVEIQDGKLIAR